MQITFSISRWWQSLGFGIQSKTDFAFLHDVIKEKLPYYAYYHMAEVYQKTDESIRKKAQLFFRIANNIMPNEIKVAGDIRKIYVDYADIAPKGNNGTLLLAGKEANIPHFHGLKAVIMTDIDDDNKSLWNRLCDTNAVTYDMRSIGIAIFYKNRTPEHYFI